MLQPETIERAQALCRDAREWIQTLAELSPDAVPLLAIAQHLEDWRRWAEDLEKELSTP